MKKIIAVLLAAFMLFSFAACGGKNTTDDTQGGSTTKQPDSVSKGGPIAPDMKAKYDNMEYTTYTNIFYNDMGGEFEGKELTKDGTFTSIYDAFNGKTRYYVWGFADKTMCCDFQWEIVMPDGTEIPNNGAYVTMTGTFTGSDDALDGYWFTDVTLTVEDAYKASEYDYDTTTMSATLARVQIINMEYHPDVFDGKTALIYGRAYNTSSIQHPYYDESWTLDFINAEKAPAIGQYLLLGGKVVKSGDTACLDVTSYTEAE